MEKHVEGKPKKSAGKGSAPRSCFSRQFRDNYVQINWRKKEYKYGKTTNEKNIGRH